jgi:hypothetical protein
VLTATLSYTPGRYRLSLYFEPPSGKYFAVSYTSRSLQAKLDEQVV